MKRILFCGDRHWRHRGLIRRVMLMAKPDVVIEGEAPGADTIAREIAESLGIPVEKFHASWEKQGKSAGPRRNQRMLDAGKPTEVFAFHNDMPHSTGTAHMVHIALKAGIPVTLFTTERATRFDPATQQRILWP